MNENESWAQTGYDEIDDATKNSGGDGGGGDGSFRGFWTPQGVTKRVVILDDNPFAFWQHSLFSLGVKGADPICLDRNGNLSQIHGKCPFCEQTDLHKETKGAQGMKLWPQYVGYITVIDCGEVKQTATGTRLQGWVNDSGVEFNFDRKYLPLKKGGKDKPGLLPRLRRYKEKRGGSLVGTVWDLTRLGQKEERPGAEWEYVGKVDVSSVEAMKKSLRGLEGYFPDVHDKILAENPTIQDNGPVPYMDIFEPKDRNFLMQYLPSSAKTNVGGGYQASAGTSSAGSDSSSVDTQDYGDEEIPF